MKLPAGFTLIELLIVIAIIGILSAISIPSFSSFTTNQRLSQAAKQVKQELRSAQNRAINSIEGDAWGIYSASPDNHSYTPFRCENLTISSSECICGTTTYLPSKSLGASFTITPLTGREKIIFEVASGRVCDSSGEIVSVSPASIEISLSGATRTITVSAGGKIEEQ